MTTKATRGQTITTLVLSALKIVTGIVVIILFKVVLDMAEHIITGGFSNISTPKFKAFYLLGLPFLVPGVFGLVAAFVKNGVAYGLYMAACIIGCVVDSIFCMLAFAFLFGMDQVDGMKCHNQLGKCICSTGDSHYLNSDPIPIGEDSCSDLNNIVGMCYGLSAMMIMGWIFCLAGSIISCSACCCKQRETQMVMMHSYPGPVVTVGAYDQPPLYPGTQYAVQGDQAPLYPGAQYAVQGDQVPLYPGAQYAAQGVPMPESEQDDKNQYNYNRMPKAT